MSNASAIDITIAPMTKDHVVGWRSLWKMNVGDAIGKAAIDHTEKELLDQQSPLFALVAQTGSGEVAALLHGSVHPVAGSINPVCYMQDLYVHPARRRQGIATRMIEALSAMGKAEKWDRVYWLSDPANAAAQFVFKGPSVKLDFDFNILPLGMLDKIAGAK